MSEIQIIWGLTTVSLFILYNIFEKRENEPSLKNPWGKGDSGGGGGPRRGGPTQPPPPDPPDPRRNKQCKSLTLAQELQRDGTWLTVDTEVSDPGSGGRLDYFDRDNYAKTGIPSRTIGADAQYSNAKGCTLWMDRISTGSDTRWNGPQPPAVDVKPDWAPPNCPKVCAPATPWTPTLNYNSQVLPFRIGLF